MKKFLIIVMSTYIALVLLMPKTELFYTLKKLLQKEHVVMTQEQVHDRWFDLKIEGLKLYYDGIESAKAADVEVAPWLFWNRLVANDVEAGSDLRKMFDFKADRVAVVQSILSPLHASLYAEGNFGTIEGTIDLKAGKVRVVCEPTKRFKNSTAFRELFKKGEEGYVYESLLY